MSGCERRFPRESQLDGSALADFAFDSGVAAVKRHDRADERKAESETASPLGSGRISAIKAVEEVRNMFGGNAAPGIADADRRRVGVILNYADQDPALRWRMSQRVAQQIADRSLNHACICNDRGITFAAELNLLLVGHIAMEIDDVGDGLPHVQCFPLHALG